MVLFRADVYPPQQLGQVVAEQDSSQEKSQGGKEYVFPKPHKIFPLFRQRAALGLKIEGAYLLTAVEEHLAGVGIGQDADVPNGRGGALQQDFLPVGHLEQPRPPPDVGVLLGEVGLGLLHGEQAQLPGVESRGLGDVYKRQG